MTLNFRRRVRDLEALLGDDAADAAVLVIVTHRRLTGRRTAHVIGPNPDRCADVAQWLELHGYTVAPPRGGN